MLPLYFSISYKIKTIFTCKSGPAAAMLLMSPSPWCDDKENIWMVQVHLKYSAVGA